jgi:hypothetical protein
MPIFSAFCWPRNAHFSPYGQQIIILIIPDVDNGKNHPKAKQPYPLVFRDTLTLMIASGLVPFGFPLDGLSLIDIEPLPPSWGCMFSSTN